MARVLLEYSFIFDNATTWNSWHEFEKDLAKFFADHGMGAEIVKTAEEHPGRRIIEVYKVDTFGKVNIPQTPIKFKGPEKAFKDLVK